MAASTAAAGITVSGPHAFGTPAAPGNARRPAPAGTDRLVHLDRPPPGYLALSKLTGTAKQRSPWSCASAGRAIEHTARGSSP